MTKALLKAIFGSLIIFSLVSITNTAHAEEKKFYTFQLIDEISEAEFNKMDDAEKIELLLRKLRQKDQLLNSLTNNLKQNKKLETVEDLLDESALKIVKDTLDQKVNKLIKKKEKEIAIKQEQVVESKKDETVTFASSVEEQINAEVNEFVFDKSTITDLNILYKITHEEDIINTMKDGLALSKNIDIFARRWNLKNLGSTYDEIAKSPENFHYSKEIADYLSCINLSDDLCNEASGKELLINNIKLFLHPEKKVEEVTNSQVTNGTNNVSIPEQFTEKISKIAVTSYNPACNQTKGGIMGEDGNCYATSKSPCAIGKNLGKTAGLCGTPSIGGSGHNLSDLKKNGDKPLAVSSDLSFLRGKEVFLRCFNKKGEELFDSRCSGLFLVYDSTHGRIKKTVDVYIDEKREDGKYNNIGGVTVEIYYNPNN